MTTLSLKIKQKLYEYFPDDKITYYKNNFIVSDCLDFYLIHDKVHFIYIEELSKSKYSGTEILNKMKELCLFFPEIIYIKLLDASRILLEDSKGNPINYTLSTLFIMISGMSWYNKHGYYQETFQKDYINYMSIINKNFRDSFQYIIDNIEQLNEDNDGFFYSNLREVYELIYNEDAEQDNTFCITKCIKFVLNNISSSINENSTISEVGKFIKDNKDIDDNTLYFKYIILTIFETVFKYQWENENKYLIKLLYV